MGAGIVIIGTGAFAHVHADALRRQRRLHLAGFAGNQPLSAAALAQKYAVRAYRDLDEVLADADVGGVIVATPHATHLEIALAALAAGKSVLVEKPLANSVAECDALIRAAQAGAGRAMVGHLMGWSPPHIQARRLLEDGAIGEIVAVDSRRIIDWTFDQRRPWQKSRQAGGGMWMIQGVHVIDQVSYLLGARAGTAFGVAETRFHPEQDADDLGIAHLRFGPVHARLLVAGTRGLAPQVHTEILGTGGQLRVSHRGELLLDQGRGWVDRLEPCPDHWQAMIDGEIAGFAALLDGEPTPVDFHYGRYVVAGVEAVRRSMRSRREETIS
ncbi:MAG: hypothetical protein ABS76_21610 [Pelagibacterium sp. SCN 64-44]|nr:MAG: hypothetical protein ABS76_21610 [Pelagibacterium sp. SCN 64-44]